MEKEKQESTSTEEEKKEESKPSIIEEAKAATLEMKEQLDRREALVAREEALRAEDMISGRADAGQAPEKPKEDTPQEYKDKVMKGEVD